MEKNELQYVTKSQGIFLKKSGFDWKCDYYYCGENLVYTPGNANDPDLWAEPEHYCSAPTVALAIKYFRDKRKITCDINYAIRRDNQIKYYFRIHNPVIILGEEYDTYEKAESKLLSALFSTVTYSETISESDF
jgi:hypothetical protein